MNKFDEIEKLVAYQPTPTRVRIRKKSYVSYAFYSSEAVTSVQNTHCCFKKCILQVTPACIISRRKSNVASFKRQTNKGRDYVRPCRLVNRNTEERPLLDSRRRKEAVFHELRIMKNAAGP